MGVGRHGRGRGRGKKRKGKIENWIKMTYFLKFENYIAGKKIRVKLVNKK